MANYINNKEFYALLQNFKEDCKEAEENGKPAPRVPEDIGKCFMMIATKLATKGTLETRAVSPRGAMIPRTLDMFVVIASKFISRLPVYTRAIMMKAKTPIANAMLETLLIRFPAK